MAPTANKPDNNNHNNNSNHNNHNENENNRPSDQLLKCFSEFFKRHLIAVPVVKKYPHPAVQQRCGLRAATLELDTAAHPSIEYVAGTRLSVYPANPASHVEAVLEHLLDDLATSAAGAALPPSSGWWARFVQINKANSLRLALTYLFDITIVPSRELIRLVSEHCGQQAEARRRLFAAAGSNEAWEKWLCSGHRTLRSVLEELAPGAKGRRSLSAVRLLAELELQTPRQYSISNIKSSKRFRAEIIVFQHKFNRRQIELNLRQLKERESFDRSVSSPKSPKSPSLRSGSTSGGPRGRSPAAARRGPPGGAPESSGRSVASTRSIRSLAPFASSPPISTHQVKRVPSFSGPLMSLYARAAASAAGLAGSEASVSGPLDGPAAAAAANRNERLRSRVSLLSAPEANFSDPANAGPAEPAPGGPLFDGLCSNYLLGLNTNDQILCEFVENPRFTLKGNRERPIMMIGQDVGLIAFRPFWQQRNLEHDRAQVFYTLFKDLAPKKFGEMQLVCLTGHKCRIEELLLKRELNLALTSRILSSVTYINRRHLVAVLSAAHTKSQLLFAQYSSTAAASKSALSRGSSSGPSSRQQPASSLDSSLPIANKELLELGDRLYKLLVKEAGCLYTCCDPHMTQAVEILLFESIARNNSQLTRERIMQLLPKWKGKDASAGSGSGSGSGSGPGPGRAPSRSGRQRQESAEPAGSIFTLENTYERARIVQEIYDNSI